MSRVSQRSRADEPRRTEVNRRRRSGDRKEIIGNSRSDRSRSGVTRGREDKNGDRRQKSGDDFGRNDRKHTSGLRIEGSRDIRHKEKKGDRRDELHGEFLQSRSREHIYLRDRDFKDDRNFSYKQDHINTSSDFPSYESPKRQREDFPFLPAERDVNSRQDFNYYGTVQETVQQQFSPPSTSVHVTPRDFFPTEYGERSFDYMPNFDSPVQNAPKEPAWNNTAVRDPHQAVDYNPANAASSTFATEKDEHHNKYLIPEFNPETSKLSAREWLKLVDDVGDEKGWDKDERKYHMSSRLAGFARQWYLPMNRRYSWSDLKSKFTEAFPSEMEYYSQLERMIARKKKESESMSSYFFHKIALLNACNITGRRAVSCIIGGLLDIDLACVASHQNCPDADSLLDFLKAHTKDKYDQQASVKDKPKYLNTNDKYCNNCGEKKHSGHTCPFKQAAKCALCHKTGHPEKYCTRDREGNNVMYGALASILTNPKYYKDVEINGALLKGYIDLASECVTIREENARAANLPFRKMYKVARGFGGSPISTLGEAQATVYVDRAFAKVTVFVVPDHVQAIPVVIGQEFTEQRHLTTTKNEDGIRFYNNTEKDDANYGYPVFDHRSTFAETTYGRY